MKISLRKYKGFISSETESAAGVTQQIVKRDPDWPEEYLPGPEVPEQIRAGEERQHARRHMGGHAPQIAFELNVREGDKSTVRITGFERGFPEKVRDALVREGYLPPFNRGGDAHQPVQRQYLPAVLDSLLVQFKGDTVEPVSFSREMQVLLSAPDICLGEYAEISLMMGGGVSPSYAAENHLKAKPGKLRIGMALITPIAFLQEANSGVLIGVQPDRAGDFEALFKIDPDRILPVESAETQPGFPVEYALVRAPQNQNPMQEAVTLLSTRTANGGLPLMSQNEAMVYNARLQNPPLPQRPETGPGGTGGCRPGR